MSKNPIRSTIFTVASFLLVFILTACNNVFATPPGLCAVPFDEIDGQKTSWQKAYDECVIPRSDNAKFGKWEEDSEQLRALTFDYTDGVIAQNSDAGNLLGDISFKDEQIANLLNGNRDTATVNTVLGECDGVFRMYRQYFKAGIDVKIVNDRITHIVFNQNYSGKLFDSIGMKSTKEKIVKLLGQPDFENSALQLFGYKTEKYYLFFTGSEKLSEISLYPCDTGYDKNAPVETMNAFSNDKTASFTELLAKIWPDYNMSPGSSSIEYLGYTSRGIVVKYDAAERTVKIDAFGNFIGNLTEDVALPEDWGKADGLDKAVYMLHPDSDSVFCAEQYRLLINQKLRGEKTDNEYDLGMAFTETNQAVFSPDENQAAYSKGGTADDAGYCCVYIISLIHQRPDIELGAWSSMRIRWIDSDHLQLSGDEISYIYDIPNKAVIPLPDSIFGGEYQIVSVGSDAVYYQK